MIKSSVQVSVSEENTKRGKSEVPLLIIHIVKAVADGKISGSNQQTTTQALQGLVIFCFYAQTEK